MYRLFPALIFALTFPLLAPAQSAEKEQLKNGVSFMDVESFYSAEQDAEILELYKNLRVADVSDGMDMVGLPGVGLVNTEIHPDWVDHDKFSHVFRGIALTVRYVPTQRSPHPPDSVDFAQWEGNFYNQYSAEPFADIIHDGHAIVIDDAQDRDIGSIGSYNILDWYSRGAVGVVTDASSRDTDEIAKQGVPLYLRKKGRGIRPGRNELESVNKPVVIGGVTVRPGDVVVADGDGVVVVPRKHARQVAKYAQEILEKDKGGRRNLYEKLNMPLDHTVKEN